MPRKLSSAPQDVSIEKDGKTYTGKFEVTKGIVTVTYNMEMKRTQVGGSPPAVIAKLLLYEMVCAIP